MANAQERCDDVQPLNDVMPAQKRVNDGGVRVTWPVARKRLL